MSNTLKLPAIMLTNEWKTASKLRSKGLFYAAKADLWSGSYGDLYEDEYYFSDTEDAIKRALESLNESIEICPQPLFYVSRATFYYHSAEYMKCIRDCNKILSLEEKEEAYSLRAMSKNKLGDLRGALDDYKKTLKVSTHYELLMSYYESMAEIKLQLKDLKGAFEDYRNAISSCPLEDAYEYDNMDKKELLMKLATLKFQNEDKIGACKCWSEAGELGEEEAYAYIRKNCN